MKYKNAVRYLLDKDSIANSSGNNIIIACDNQRIDIPITEMTKFYRFSFMPLKKPMVEVYSELVRNEVFTPSL